ncbi:MAG: flavin reductase [Gemmatimonadetes bacterium]|nr:flavin reductase [Gemmatimonadota bacterium]
MTLDSAEFRRTMALMPTGVTVVALAHGDGVRAMTVGSFTSLSLEPALVLFCIGRKSRLAQCAEVGRPFSVSFLRADQQALSTYFAGGWKGPTPPPHRFVPFGALARLEGSAGAVGGTLSAVLDGGDHLIVVGAVSELAQGLPPNQPLVFFDRHYHQLDPSTPQSAPDLDPVDGIARLFHETWEQ